jgi:hypothetical protein
MERRFATLPFLLFVASAFAQNSAADSTGLPGDHFSLQGALELFKQAKDLQSFEQSLNTEEQRVNNLDLDANGEVDYVRVIDHREGDAHAIALQVALGKEEFQDVAVIELEKNGEQSALLQIRGAVELYGDDVYVEPFEEKEGEPAMKGPAMPLDGPRVRVWVNVWAWPCVTWIYGPSYVAWTSPWYWGYYPPWWRPWRPWGWRAWYGWHRPYYGWYHHVNICRAVRANTLYQHRAVYSPRVRTATAEARQRRAAMPDKRVAPEQRSVHRTIEGERPSTRERSDRTRQTRAIQRTPRTQPAQRPVRSPRPARQPAPTRTPNRR